jgi:hypothetical protein
VQGIAGVFVWVCELTRMMRIIFIYLAFGTRSHQGYKSAAIAANSIIQPGHDMIPF